jgi:hypothetical protein
MDLKKIGWYGGREWTRFIWLRIWTSVGSWEHSYGPTGSIKCREFLD